MRVALFALLLAGCFSPRYQNGKPCSASGGCPSGFACVNGACYRPGEGPAADLGVDTSVDMANAGQDLSDLPPPDLTPVIVSAPPPGYWLSGGGDSLESTSTNQLNLSLGEVGLTGTLTAPSGATVELGLFAGDVIQ